MKIELLAAAAKHPGAALVNLALQPITLTIEAGEQVAIIGPSGAGKTTLLHLIACALAPVQAPEFAPVQAPEFAPVQASKPAPASGLFKLAGRDPWRLAKRDLQTLRGDLFLAPQTPPLPPRQRVVTSVLAGRLPEMGFWSSIGSLFYPIDIPAAHAALSQFDLADKLFERVDKLSGGERQRVGLARGLVSKSKLWLIDEPLSALDPASALQAIEVLTGSAQIRGITLVTSLHHVPMALAHFPRIIGLKAGALVFDLPTTQVTPALLQDLYAHHLDALN